MPANRHNFLLRDFLKANAIMDYSIVSLSLDKLQSDCLLVGIYENQQLSPAATAVDSLCKGLLPSLTLWPVVPFTLWSLT